MKTYLQGRVADVWARVEGKLAEPCQQWEPEVHVFILVAELQPLPAPALSIRGSQCS